MNPLGSSYTIDGLTGSVINIEALGTDSSSRFQSGSGDDFISTHEGFYSDYIATNAGNDSVKVFSGTDVVDMGPGNDTLIVDYSANGYDKTSESTDPLYAWSGSLATGYNGAYAYRSNPAENSVPRVVFTGVENFYVTLGSGNDLIRTGDGNDTFFGGAGDDVLTSGGGSDVFSYASSGNGVDTLTDFAPGDVIRVATANFSSAVQTGNGSALAQYQVQVSTSGSVTTLTIGTDATPGADITIRLNGVFAPSQLYASGANIGFVSAAPQTVTGGNASDKFTSGSGNDIFDGGAGTDTVIFSGTRAAHTITKTATGWTVSSSADGTDTIKNVERLQFSDSSVALDLDAANSAGGIYRLYGATFNRTPDLGGLGYWIAQADKGKSAVDMAIDFTYSPEFQSLFATKIIDNYATGANVVNLVTGFYTNVLHRTPDAAGRDWYANEITTHSRTVGQVLAEISDSPENVAQLAGVIANGIVFTAWNG
jgi:Ca2+-binding RTX toxin-like protein